MCARPSTHLTRRPPPPASYARSAARGALLLLVALTPTLTRAQEALDASVPSASAPGSDAASAEPTATPPVALPPVTLPAPAADSAAAVAAPTAPEPAVARPTRRVDQVVRVTGSRVKQGSADRANHVLSVTAAELRGTGATTLNEALLRIPSVTFQGFNKNNNNGGRGLAFVDLRNLGVSRTLVLVNGRRQVATSAGAGEAVDLNNIPLSLVKQVDVLLDGASAVYGSDAIAGVVNILLRDDFDGVRADSFAGLSSHGDAEELGGSVTLGKNHGRGNLTLNIEGLVRRPVLQRNRDWSRDVVTGRTYVDANNHAAGVQTQYGDILSPAGGDGTSIFVPNPATGQSFSPADPLRGDNYGKDAFLVVPQERLSMTLLGAQDLSDSIRVFIEASHTYRHSQARLAPDGFYESGTSTFPDGLQVPLGHPLVPRDYAESLGPDATSLRLVRRNRELGDQLFDSESQVSRAVLGIAGEVPKWELDWELYGNLGISRTTDTGKNALNFARARETVDPELCAANAARGCTLGNYFGAGALQPAVVDYIRYTDVETTGYSHLSSGASVSARPFNIFGEPVGMASGLLFRRERGFAQPSALAASGDASSNARDPVHGSFRSLDLYGELNIPVLANLPAVDLLRVDLAGRYSNNQGFGAALTYRAGLLYAPLRELSIRASYSTAFLSPGVTARFSGNVESFEGTRDPCSSYLNNPEIDPQTRQNCEQLGIPADYDQKNTGATVSTNLGGNKNLQPETARILNIGAKLSPQFKDGRAGQLTVSADYYRLTVDDAIGNGLGQDLVDNCYRSLGLSAASCRFVQRDALGRLARVDARYRNLDSAAVSGIDFMASYRLPLSTIGVRAPFDLTAGWQGHRLLYADDRESGNKQRRGGTLDPANGSYPNWRWNLTAALSGSSWSVLSTVRHIGGASIYGADASTVDRSVESVNYWDVVATYAVRKSSVLVGVNNLLDRTPPFALDYSTNSSPNTYDYVGRYIYMRLSHQL
jgi:iron complex outermembrane recepter protein